MVLKCNDACQVKRRRFKGIAARHVRALHRLPHQTLRRNFPLWLAPEQVRVLTLNDDEKLVAYAKEIHRELRANEVRAEADFSPDPIKAKIAEAEKAKVHAMLVIGGREAILNELQTYSS